MKIVKLLIILFIFSGSIFAQNTDEIVIAKRMKINSKVMGEERMFFVSTPVNYEHSNNSYPVMYVLDGTVESIISAAGLVQDLSTRSLCPEMIIVAIANTDRFRDMTPTIYKRNPNRPSGGADTFLKFIETELFPFIAENYRTLPYSIIKGHSASGICVTHAFLSHNHMFNSYIGISPSLWWDSNLFSKTAEEKLGKMNLKHKHYYFSTGSKETAHNISGGQSFFEVLTKKNPADLQWKFDHIQNEDHGSQATIAMYNALRFIYDDWKINRDSIRSGGLSYINTYYQQKSETYGYEISPSETEMNSFGYALKRYDRLEESITMFKKITLKHPESANAFDSLADAYIAAEEIDLAIENYGKAVELGTKFNDPNLDTYQRNLEKAKALK